MADPQASRDVEAATLALEADPTPANEQTLRKALRVAGASQAEIERTVSTVVGVVPLTTRRGLPLDGIPADMLEQIDRLAVERGTTREVMLEALAEIGLAEVETGRRPLAPRDEPANDAPSNPAGNGGARPTH